MSSYIDKDKALKFVLTYTPHINGETTMECVERAIQEIPTADVVEVRHGKWHYPPYAPFGGSYEMKRCSICGYKPDFDADNPYSNFCPNCGAKMDGARRENA